MSDKENLIDPVLLAEFIDEANEGLDNLPDLFIQLEKDPGNFELINAIFRPVHTIKGNSAFFGLLNVKNLTHELETLLDKMRKGEVSVSAEKITLLLKSLDFLSIMLDRVRNNESEVPDEKSLDSLITNLQSACEDSESIDAKLKSILENVEELYEKNFIKADGELLILQVISDLKSISNSDESDGKGEIPEFITKFIHDLSNNVYSDKTVHEIKEVLLTIEAKTNSEKANEAIKECLDNYDTLAPTVGCDEILTSLIVESLETLDNTNDWKPSEVESEEKIPEIQELKEEVATVPTENKVKDKMAIAKTMRIPENTIDDFLTHIGELIVVREMFEHLRKKINENVAQEIISVEFRRLTEEFSNVTLDLEDSVMSIRKQKMQTIFNRAPKIVRDICLEKGKEIEVKIIGEDIEVDKSLLGILDGPLVHMVRNAADHGIELPEERVAASKSPMGLITISMEELEETLLLKISDDGKGLNFDALRAKAVELEIIKADEELDEESTIELLFMSGVSTAKEVTDVSGRGVGLDVVRRGIESIGGKIKVFSEPNNGSTFSIQLPKGISTQILNGFIVMVGGNKFVLPVSRIVESFPPTDGIPFQKHEKDNFVKRYDQIFKVIQLREIFKITGELPTQSILVVVEEKNKKVAIEVDEIIGIQQVVLKPLEGLNVSVDIFSGGALMGDGSIALIIDVEHFFSNYVKELQESNS
ncbi:MAG: hypothetical protein COA79_00810 [Planctomycetota bacterium]|nr:MAG: hypothetical protein COA79_00810 [Planctomycetota bacterium]